jgi:single-strand DNA-binding protein
LIARFGSQQSRRFILKTQEENPMNKVILMGRLTKDPEVRYTASNKAVATYTLAVDRPGTSKDNKKTDFIQCVAWEKRADFAKQYLQKGMQLLVEGVWTTRTWDGEDGHKHYASECQVDKHYFTGTKKDGQGTGEYTGGGYGSGTPDGFMPIDADDDLPF